MPLVMGGHGRKPSRLGNIGAGSPTFPGMITNRPPRIRTEQVRGRMIWTNSSSRPMEWSVRPQLVKFRTAQINGLRGLPTDYREVMPQGRAGMRRGIAEDLGRVGKSGTTGCSATWTWRPGSRRIMRASPRPRCTTASRRVIG